MIKVLLTGGGSGGHIYPLLAVLDELAQIKNEDFKIYYMGPKSHLNREFTDRDVPIYSISSGKIRRYLSFLNILDVPKFFFGFLQALIYMFRIMPNVVFSKGGPGALPVVLAAKFYFIPVIIHESDSVPGNTNKISGHFAKRIGISFEEATKFFPAGKTALVGNPIRKTLFLTDFSREHAKQHFGFDTNIPTIFFVGGSQGALQINDFVIENLEDLLGQFQVLHMTGEKNFKESEELSKFTLKEMPSETKRKYYISPYFDFADLRFAYSAADVVISRAGSGSIFEIAAFGRASILVPLKTSAHNHQKANAYSYAKSGASIVIETDNFKLHIVSTKIKQIIENKVELEKMEEAAKNFAKPDAATVIAEEIAKLGGKN